MAFLQFPNKIISRAILSNETTEICQLNDTGILSHIGIYIWTRNIMSGQKLQLEIRDTDGTTVLGESEILTIPEVTNNVTYWIGWIRFKFTKKVNLKNGLRLFLKASDYTYIENVWEINLNLNYLNPTYTTSETAFNNLPADIQVFKYE